MLLSTPLNVLIVKVRRVCIDATAVSNPGYSTIYAAMQKAQSKFNNDLRCVMIAVQHSAIDRSKCGRVPVAAMYKSMQTKAKIIASRT